MKQVCKIILVFAILLFALEIKTGFALNDDWRNIVHGNEIPSLLYSDQPFLIKTDDGAWLCVMTTGIGHEGQQGQHLISQRSFDRGKTWVDRVEIEPSDGPEASYAVMYKAPSGRVFVFYNHNTDNLRYVLGDNPPFHEGKVRRVDSQGYFVFKYSDDHGKSWSERRHTIPVREFQIDRDNVYQGAIRFFWNVGRAFHHQGDVYVPLIKVGGFGEGFFTSNEGVLLKSDNLALVEDPAEANWQTLPDGDIGLRTPPGGGPIAAEQSFSVLSDGSFYVVYRTIDGYPVFSYSRDNGHTWDTPRYKRYASGGLMKNPRAANFAWKCENGKYLYWFHNHGGRYIREHPNRLNMAFDDRNPVWISGGIETDGPDGRIIQWSQPEILLYDDDPLIRMSYPDLIEEGGKYYMTETQKHIARVHLIDHELLDGVWGQFENAEKTTEGLVFEWQYAGDGFPQYSDAPRFASFHQSDYSKVGYGGSHIRKGFTVDIQFTLETLHEGQVLLDARDAFGNGWNLTTTGQGTIQLLLNDGRTQSVWDCDSGVIQPGQTHYMSIIVDGGPKVIAYIVDGVFNDGGEERQFGWGRFNPYLRSVSHARQISVGKKIQGVIHKVSIYNRALTVSEAIGNFRNTAGY